MESNVEKLEKLSPDKPAGQSAGQSGRPSDNTISGTGMDKRIERKRPKWVDNAVKYGGGAVALIALYLIFAPEGGRALKVENDRISVSTVTTGQFDDFIPVRARVTPLKTIYLDAVEGGQVEAIHIEDGNVVERGQMLVELSNTSLQLDVISREAQVVEQLNNSRTLELQQEQNRLSHKRQIIDIEYQITRLGRNIARQEELAAGGYTPRSDFEDLKDEYAYYQRRLEVQLESQASDEQMQDAQLNALRASSDQMEKNLSFARKNLESLNFRAPADGQLTAFDLEVGQSLRPGERIGQIDDPDKFKLVADIDEFYLGRVDIGQTAEYQSSGRSYMLRIAKIYPQVNNGQFEVDLVFSDETPSNIRRGQTAQTRLQLGDPTEAVLIPNGAFYQDTGGNWIFIVSSDGTRAVRRDIRLGRRNLRFIEVLDGLEPGEQVVTSPYTNYLDMERLEISE